MDSQKTIKYILSGFIFLNFLIVIINFFTFRSLWLDEAALALNIVDKSIFELLEPLDINQVAPIGFLMIEKFFASLFGNSDWSMRIFPVISFFISSFLIFKLSLKLVSEKPYALFSAAFFGSSYFIVYYSSEVKQYISDTSVCLLILLATIHYARQKGITKLWAYSLLGVLSIWISNISIILLTVSGLYFLMYIHKNKNYIDALFVIGTWILSFSIYYAAFIYKHPTQDMMLTYWSDAGAFFPENIMNVEFYLTLLLKIQTYFEIVGYKYLGLMLFPIFGAGVLHLYRWNRNLLFLLVSPIVLHLILAYFKLYPFDLRLILYLHPILVIISTCGLYSIALFFKSQNAITFQSLLIIPIVLNIVLLGMRGFPTENEEIKDSLRYMRKNVRENDQLYVYEGAYLAFNFYEKNDPELIKVDKKNIIIGNENRENWANYEEDILRLNNSVWILFSHVYWKKNQDGINEEDYIVRLFEKNGYAITNQQKFAGSSIYNVVKN